jgi:hypothetical protein
MKQVNQGKWFDGNGKSFASIGIIKSIIFDFDNAFYGRIIYDRDIPEFIWYVQNKHCNISKGIADSWEEAMDAVEFVAENNGGKVV